MNAAGRCRAYGSIRAAVALVSRWTGHVRWVSSGMTLGATEGEIKLTGLIKEKLNPTYLAVEDVSGGCGAAYIIHIDSEQFRGKRPVQQHKLVTEAIGDEMKNIHSVSIKIGSPDR